MLCSISAVPSLSPSQRTLGVYFSPPSRRLINCNPVIMVGQRTSLAVAVCALMIAAVDSTSGGPRGNVRRQKQQRRLQSMNDHHGTSYERVYFSKTMSGEDPVVVFEAGPFKLEASCRTITYPEMIFPYEGSATSTSASSENGASYPDHTSYYRVTQAEGLYTSAGYRTDEPLEVDEGGRVPETADGPCGRPLYETSSSTVTEKYEYQDYSLDRDLTALMVVLDLTYTATDADYVFGTSHYTLPELEDQSIPGSYEAGESRKMTAFFATAGASNEQSTTLQATSGHYIHISGEDTIGMHKKYATQLPGGSSSFPDGVDCMVAGFVTYIVPSLQAEVKVPILQS